MDTIVRVRFHVGGVLKVNIDKSKTIQDILPPVLVEYSKASKSDPVAYPPFRAIPLGTPFYIFEEDLEYGIPPSPNTLRIDQPGKDRRNLTFCKLRPSASFECYSPFSHAEHTFNLFEANDESVHGIHIHLPQRADFTRVASPSPQPIRPNHFPKGEADFRSIRLEHKFHADHTQALSAILCGPKFSIFVRPPRFGKSLLVSMLGTYVDVGTTEKDFKTLFHEMDIVNKALDDNGCCRAFFVLPLSMPELRDSFDADLESHVNDAINNSINTARTKYGLEYEPVDKCELNLELFIDAAAAKGSPVFITIDEYDCVARKLAHRADDDVKANAARSMLTTIIGVIKRKDAKCRLFMTGVTPLALHEISAAANFISNVSLTPNLALACGLSHDEVKEQLRVLQEKSLEVKDDADFVDDMFEFMAHYCNGYRFVPNEPTTVFNPQQCIHFFQYMLNYGTKDVLDRVRDALKSGVSVLSKDDKSYLKGCFDTHTQICSHAFENLPPEGGLIVEVAQALAVDGLVRSTTTLEAGLTYKDLKNLKGLNQCKLITHLFHQGAVTFAEQGKHNVLKSPNLVERDLTVCRVLEHFTKCENTSCFLGESLL